MKSSLRHGLPRQDYGAATPTLHEILRTWETIDWFAPPQDADAEAAALESLARHNALARAHHPVVFPARVSARTVRGGWKEFADLCHRVTTQAWDWKSALKTLSSSHTLARGWKLQEQRFRCVSLSGPLLQECGELFLPVGNNVLWNWFTAPLDMSGLRADEMKVANFYLGHTHRDLIDALEWQLAEDGGDLEGNPFFHLVRCHQAGYLAFGLASDDFVLFGFS
jgi:hypothetical protein